MGKAILHVHTTHSDGMASVAEIMDEVERGSDVDVISFTDHDEIGAYAEAVDWQRRNPGCRLQVLWGTEITSWRFKHLLAFFFEPPYPDRPFKSQQPLVSTIQEVLAAGGLVVVPHVDVFWVGLGRKRLEPLLGKVPIAGLEVYSPCISGSVAGLKEFCEIHSLAESGGGDAHYLQELYKVIVHFPGNSLADLKDAFQNRRTGASWGPRGAPISIADRCRQQYRAMIDHPSRKVLRWWASRGARGTS
ncbi:MAG: hypothetical protein M1358_22165 [Chloroflexi bacterium]|nr:hypothetical protein [Chloroflexota bacterium]